MVIDKSRTIPGLGYRQIENHSWTWLYRQIENHNWTWLSTNREPYLDLVIDKSKTTAGLGNIDKSKTITGPGYRQVEKQNLDLVVNKQITVVETGFSLDDHILHRFYIFPS